MKEEALKLANELDDLHQYVPSEAPLMIRELVEEYKKVSEIMGKYKKVLIEIANDYPELSYDKARMQNLDHIKWAKEVLNETV